MYFQNKIKTKYTIFIMLLVLFLTGCSTQSNLYKIAKTTQSQVEELKQATIGETPPSSIAAYYTDMATKWQEISNNKPPKAYIEGIQAQQTIATFMKSQANGTEAMHVIYIGTVLNDGAEGIFIYELKEAPAQLLTPAVIEQANSFTTASETGEFFHVNGQYLISCEYGYVQDTEQLFKIIDQAISTTNN